MAMAVAQQSDCQKRHFGAVAVKDGRILLYRANMKLPYHAYLCEGECIRMKIDSGMDSMIGACGHAEERLIWALGAGALGSDIYVLQVDMEGKAIPVSTKRFYCARCATTMYYAGVRGVWVFVVDHWEFLTTEEAIRSSYEFALGEKKA